MMYDDSHIYIYSRYTKSERGLQICMFDHLNADVFAGVVLILMRQFSDKHVRDGNPLGLTGMPTCFTGIPTCSVHRDSSSGFV